MARPSYAPHGYHRCTPHNALVRDGGECPRCVAEAERARRDAQAVARSVGKPLETGAPGTTGFCRQCGCGTRYAGKRNGLCSQCWEREKARKNVKACKACGKEFHPRTGGQKYCSAECARESTLANKRAYMAAQHTRYKRTCTECGKEFEPDRSNQVTCSRDCSKAHKRARATERQRERRLEQRAGCLQPLSGQVRTCKICGNEFVPSVQWQKCCSKACTEANKSNWRKERG